jgi:AraC-like DNA-binding protein
VSAEPHVDTRAFLARVLSIDYLLPSDAERERITRNLKTSMERQKAGRASLESQRADPLSQMFSYGNKPRRRKGRPKSAKPVPIINEAQREQAKAIYLSGEWLSLSEIARKVGLTPSTLARWLAVSGLREIQPADPAVRRALQVKRESELRPAGCLSPHDVQQELGLAKASVGRRIRTAGLKPKLKIGGRSWYDEDEMRASSVFRR